MDTITTQRPTAIKELIPSFINGLKQLNEANTLLTTLLNDMKNRLDEVKNDIDSHIKKHDIDSIDKLNKEALEFKRIESTLEGLEDLPYRADHKSLIDEIKKCAIFISANLAFKASNESYLDKDLSREQCNR